jgi:hypothetical protein
MPSEQGVGSRSAGYAPPKFPRQGFCCCCGDSHAFSICCCPGEGVLLLQLLWGVTNASDVGSGTAVLVCGTVTKTPPSPTRSRFAKDIPTPGPSPLRKEGRSGVRCASPLYTAGEDRHSCNTSPIRSNTPFKFVNTSPLVKRITR